jgi:hypothetical protein
VNVWSLPVLKESGVDVESRDGASMADPMNSMPSKDTSRVASIDPSVESSVNDRGCDPLSREGGCS